MKLTQEQIEKNVEAYRAWQRGEQIERQEYRDGPWLEFASQNGLFKNDLLRLKPQPKLRAWEPEEVPVGARYRYQGRVGYCGMIVGFCPSFIVSSIKDAGEENDGTIGYQEMLELYEHSTDGGKTWHPCGVME